VEHQTVPSTTYISAATAQGRQVSGSEKIRYRNAEVLVTDGESRRENERRSRSQRFQRPLTISLGFLLLFEALFRMEGCLSE
jgi:hypothetical protein